MSKKNPKGTRPPAPAIHSDEVLRAEIDPEEFLRRRQALESHFSDGLSADAVLNFQNNIPYPPLDETDGRR